MKNRRKVILWGVAAVLALAASLWLRVGTTKVVVNEQTINLPHLAAADENLRVAVLSDPHFGPGDAGRAAMLADKLNKLDPDLILLLGDFVNGSPDHRRSLSLPELTRFVRSLKARCGVFAVTGNHELWYGRDEVNDALRLGGATVLRNECVTVATPSGRPLQLVGLPDYTTEAPPEKFPATAPGVPTLVVLHDPMSAKYVPEKFPCFCIAGHTHGGQLRMIPNGGDRSSLRLLMARIKDKLGMIPQYNRPYVLFDRGFTDYHGRRIFITCGTGLARLPVRTYCPPEVVLLKLRVADPEAAKQTFMIPEEL